MQKCPTAQHLDAKVEGHLTIPPHTAAKIVSLSQDLHWRTFSPHLHSAQHPEVVINSLADDVHVCSDKLYVALAKVRAIAGHVGHLVQFVEESAHHGSLVVGREFAQGFLQDGD